jgi:hypothetical protein
MAPTTVNANAETNEILKQLESKMSGIMGVVDSLSRKIEETNDMFVSSDSAYFLNMADALSTSMHESEMDRRMYEEAMEQNRRAEALSRGKSPERGDSNFWAQAFAPTPVSPAEAQANALKSTFTDSGVMDAFKNLLGGGGKQDEGKALGDIIKESVRGNVDDRTFGEKALDKIGLGGINKLKNWWADRDVKKEQKATEKDQGTIKREQKTMDRLAAKYRKMKDSGASEDELLEIQNQYLSHQENQKSAASRISRRNNDDLFETAMPTRPEDSMKSMMDMAMKNMSAPGMQTASGITPAADVSAALAPTVARPRLQQIMGDEIVDDVRTKDVTDDKNEPVELAKETDGSLGAVGDKKEAADIQRKLDTTLRPDFYKEGIQFFKKGNSGALFDGLSGMLGGGGMGSLGKAGLYAAAAAAVGASLAKIGQAAMLVKDWFNASSEAVENVKKMTDQNIANLEKRKKGHNDEMITASQESLRAQQQLHESEESWNDSLGTVFIDHGPLSWLGFKSDRKKAREAKEAADKKTDAERKKYEAMRAAAQKSGVDIKNDAELNKFKALYDKGQADQYKAAKLAAGNMQESGQQQTAQTPGAKAEPDKAVTAEEQMKRQEEATYNATKRALLDNDVQRQNEENAKIQGQQIDQSLNGRK